MSASTYRLRLPGPTAVPERVRQAIARPVLNHRGPEFVALLDQVQRSLQAILGTRAPVLLFASSGTGVMEAALVNVLAPGERVLACTNGQFGERFASIARALGAEVDTVEAPWGQPIDPGQIERRLAANDYRAVLVVHNESSTGVANDVARIGALLRESPTLLLVDSVSGLAGMEMRQDEWGLDIAVSASQKCLMCPPGIGVMSVSAKAWEVIQRQNGLPRFYWDLRKAMRGSEVLETPFTPPVSMLFGLDEALRMIKEEGLPRVLARHCRLASALRAGCAALGLPSFAQPGAQSSTVVALQVPEPLQGGDIVRLLYERCGTVIAGLRSKLKGRVIRIGTMGHLKEADILTDLLDLERVLTELRWPLQTGAGAAAALEVFHAG